MHLRYPIRLSTWPKCHGSRARARGVRRTWIECWERTTMLPSPVSCTIWLWNLRLMFRFCSMYNVSVHNIPLLTELLYKIIPWHSTPHIFIFPTTSSGYGFIFADCIWDSKNQQQCSVMRIFCKYEFPISLCEAGVWYPNHIKTSQHTENMSCVFILVIPLANLYYHSHLSHFMHTHHPATLLHFVFFFVWPQTLWK